MPFVLSFLFVIELFILHSVWNGGCCYRTGVNWVLGKVRGLRSLYKWRVSALQQPWCPLGADKVVWETFVLSLLGCLQQLWLESNSWRELADNKGNFSLLMIWGKDEGLFYLAHRLRGFEEGRWQKYDRQVFCPTLYPINRSLDFVCSSRWG